MIFVGRSRRATEHLEWPIRLFGAGAILALVGMWAQQGWMINKNGNAEFNNVNVRGTSTVERLVVRGTVFGSVAGPNNSVGVVGHGSGRPVVASVWSPSGAASLTDMNDQTFSVRVDFAGDATCFYSYF